MKNAKTNEPLKLTTLSQYISVYPLLNMRNRPAMKKLNAAHSPEAILKMLNHRISRRGPASSRMSCVFRVEAPLTERVMRKAAATKKRVSTNSEANRTTEQSNMFWQSVEDPEEIKV